ncbi:MAG: sensor histidine kinase [Candidatus Dormibacteria bacterium]
MDLAEAKGLYIFDGIPDEALAAALAESTEVAGAPGEVLWVEGEPADYWWVLIEGSLEFLRRESKGQDTIARTFSRPGDWGGGLRAWADSAPYAASGRAGTPTRVLRVPAATLRRLVLERSPLGISIIEAIFATWRGFEAVTRQRAALVALGQLAAGLAHELNNPASAASRTIEALRLANDELLSTLANLGKASLTAEQFVALDELRRDVGPPIPPGETVALADREEELTTWLDAHGVKDSWRFAPPLAAAGADIAWCERVAAILSGELLGLGLEWVECAVSTQSLITEVKDSTSRISALVSDVRGYSQLDRAAQQLTDVSEGLESTLSMFGERLRDGVTVVRDYAPELPRIMARPAELNQVWTNLIVNAIDAMDGHGTLRISTRADGSNVVVEVGDTGAGMTPQVQEHAFDAFFTTKDVGKGTGLGLDISRRIVEDGHHGSINVESQPGNTVFRVSLPQAGTGH